VILHKMGKEMEQSCSYRIWITRSSQFGYYASCAYNDLRAAEPEFMGEQVLVVVEEKEFGDMSDEGLRWRLFAKAKARAIALAREKGIIDIKNLTY